MTPEHALKVAKSVKEEIVRSHPDRPDLPPSALMIRAGNAVARVFLGGDTIRKLTGIGLATPLFGADTVIVVDDAYSAKPEMSDEEERGLRGGDLRRLWEQGRRDVVSECLTVLWANRESEAWTSAVPYEQDGSRVRWGEPIPVMGGRDLGGAFPDGLRFIMARSGETDLGAALDLAGVTESFGLSPLECRIHADAAIGEWLARHDFPTVLMAWDEESAALLAQALGDER